MPFTHPFLLLLLLPFGKSFCSLTCSFTPSCLISPTFFRPHSASFTLTQPRLPSPDLSTTKPLYGIMGLEILSFPLVSSEQERLSICGLPLWDQSGSRSWPIGRYDSKPTDGEDFISPLCLLARWKTFLACLWGFLGDGPFSGAWAAFLLPS